MLPSINCFFLFNVKGLWDNLFDDEVAALCGIALSPLESLWLTGSVFMSTAPRDVAKGLALSAYWKSIQLTCETPFTQSVRDIGGINSGGKPDDITVCIYIYCDYNYNYDYNYDDNYSDNYDNDSDNSNNNIRTRMVIMMILM